VETAAELHEAGTLLVKEGKLEEAVRKFEKVLEHRPEWVQVRYDVAKICFQLGKDRYVEHVELTLRAGRALLEAGDDETTVDELLGKARKARETSDAYLDQARRHLERVVRSETTDEIRLDAYITLGLIHTLAGRLKDAHAAYVKAREMKPPEETLRKISKAIDHLEKEIDASRR
jgi:Flp pilus assembly protein TadD